MQTTRDFEYTILQKGVGHYTKTEISNPYGLLALRLVMSLFVEKIPNEGGENKHQYRSNNRWVPVSEAKELSINAPAILEELYQNEEMNKRPCAQTKVSNS